MDSERETCFTYDADDQLVCAEKDGQVFEYTYDRLGRRVARKDAFGEIRYPWDGDRLIQEQRRKERDGTRGWATNVGQYKIVSSISLELRSGSHA